MAKSLNKVQLIGNVGKDPDVQYLQSGSTVAKFSVATSSSYKKENGQQIENTEWHNIEAWGKVAENVVAKYVKKGDKIFVEGSLKTDVWEKDGVKRYLTKVRVHNIILLGGKQSDSTSIDEGTYTSVDDAPDDLPFY